MSDVARDDATRRRALLDRDTVAAVAPAAAATVVFGAIFGALARPEAGPWATVLMSLIIFSGAVQFSLAGLMLSGGPPSAMLLSAVVLNVRLVLMGAVLRRRLDRPPLARAGLAWFLVDEGFGLAMAARERVAETLLTSGSVLYVAWNLGTVLGVLGGSLDALEEAATSVFPVLFVGLATLSARTADLVVRTVAAAAITVAAALLWPDARTLVPIVAAIAVSLPGRTR